MKCRSSFTKSPSLVLIRLVLTEMQPFKNVQIHIEMYGHPDAVGTTASGRPYVFIILTFSNRYVSVKTNLINTKLGDFMKSGNGFSLRRS